MLRAGVLGCGRIGRIHAANLARHPGVELVSVFDPAAGAAAEVAGGLGVRVAASAGEMIGDRSIAAVLIATPTDTHVALIIEAARAGKAVFCEKPIDLDLARAEACWRAIEPLEPRVMIGFNRRFDPSLRALGERVAAGEIGALQTVVITSRDPAPPSLAYIASSGGLFRDMTIHDFDMARFIAGEIAEVHALGANLVDPAIGEAGDIDVAMVTMRARSGALVHINNARHCAYGYDQRVEAFGTKGMLQAANLHRTTLESWTAERAGARDPVPFFFLDRYAAAYAAEIDHFVGSIAGGRAPVPGFADGVEALRLADAATECLKVRGSAPSPAEG